MIYLVIIILILFLIFNNINKIKYKYENFYFNINESKINVKIFYNSSDMNSIHFIKQATMSYKSDISNQEFITEYINKLNSNIFKIDFIDCNEHESLEDCFVNTLEKEQYITFQKYFLKNKVPHKFLDKVPKILLFFKKI